MKRIALSFCIFAVTSCSESPSNAVRAELIERIETLRSTKSDDQREITDQALVVQTSQVSEFFDSNPQMAFRHEPPQFELRIPCQTEDLSCINGIWSQVLPASGRDVILTHWADAIRFHYANRVFYAGMTREERKRLTDLHERNMNRMFEELSEVEVQTPAQLRRLSHFEIGQITEQMNRFAQAVVDRRFEAARHRSA